MAFLRSGDCDNCGQCCGGNGLQPTSTGFEAIRYWSLDDVAESYNLWTLFGLGWDPVTESIKPESSTFVYKVKGKNYPGEWVFDGRWTKPQKSAVNVECPFLLPDPGDGSRPCALIGSQEEGSRRKFCRPWELPEPVDSLWSDRSVELFQSQHTLCSMVFSPVVLVRVGRLKMKSKPVSVVVG